MNDKTKNKQAPGDLQVRIISRKDFWQGFTEETIYTRKPSIKQTQQMLQYPAIRSAIRIVYMPLLAAQPQITAEDEVTKNILEYWFSRYYRKIATLMFWKAMGWGKVACEKVLKPVEINGRTYHMPQGIIAPPSYAIRLLYGDPLEITGFEYEGIKVDKESMALYIYQGDEICVPNGISLCEDVFWAWQQLMEDWSRWAIFKDFKAVPPFILRYPEALTTADDGTVYDKNAQVAADKLKNMRTISGISLPRKYIEAEDKMIDLWDLKEIALSERTTAFIESINKGESLVFIGAIAPKRMIEQDIQVGAYSMVESQKDFFYVIEETRLEEWEEYLRRWIIDPMLIMNTGKVNGTVNLDFGDDLIPWFLEVLKVAVAGGQTSLDFDEMADRAGAPRIKGTPEPRIETERFKGKTVATYQQTRAEQEKIKKKLAEDHKDYMNKHLLPFKELMYQEISKELRKVQGKMGIRLAKMEEDKEITRLSLAAAVQIPRTIFSNTLPFFIKAWHVGADPLFKKVKQKTMDRPNFAGMNYLRLLAMKFEGIGGVQGIGGQPELLEERLFYSCMHAYMNQNENVVDAFNVAFNNYIEVTLPTNILNELNICAQSGVMNAVQELKMRDLQRLKEGG